jgi:hypothetical protein
LLTDTVVEQQRALTGGRAGAGETPEHRHPGAVIGDPVQHRAGREAVWVRQQDQAALSGQLGHAVQNPVAVTLGHDRVERLGAGVFTQRCRPDRHRGPGLVFMPGTEYPGGATADQRGR